MKGVRKLFIAALAVLFGPVVDMRGQGFVPGENFGSVSSTFKHKSSKSLKQKRAASFIESNSNVVALGPNVFVQFVLSADCQKKEFTVTASQIAVKVPGKEYAVPMSDIPEVVKAQHSRLDALQERYRELEKQKSPGYSGPVEPNWKDAFEDVKREMEQCNQIIDGCLNVRDIIGRVLAEFAQFIIGG